MNTQRNPPIGRALPAIIAAAVATTAALILLGFASSYVALADWAKNNGDPGWVHHVWPLFLEGFVAVGSLFVLAAALGGRRAWYPLALVIAGNAGSIAFNVYRADSTPAKFTAAVPPIAALLAFELASRELYKALTGRTAPETVETLEADTDAVPDTKPVPDTKADTGRPRTDTGAAIARLRSRAPNMTQADIAQRLGISERTVRRHLTTKAGATVVPLRSTPSGTG